MATSRTADAAWLKTLLRRYEQSDDADDQKALLLELLQRHEQLSGKEARNVRHAFLKLVETSPELLAEEEISHFLAEQVEADDFDDYAWETPNHVISFYEMLFGFRFQDDGLSEKLSGHARALLKRALHSYEQNGQKEEMFELLRLAPTPLTASDPELWRLRHQAYLYETKRIRRRRQFLYGYLILQFLLILVVFPLLFVNAENGKLQDQIENATKVQMPEEARRSFTYLDGLYWSVITAGSIGYGDITPRTSVGRIIASVLGMSGVITVGRRRGADSQLDNAAPVE